MGAINGHGNGYGIATAQSVLANGGAFGKRLLSEAGRERVLERQADGVDVVLDIPIRWGLGYSVSSDFLPGGTSGSRVAFWAGGGGSMSWVDLDHRMSFGFAPNHWMTGPHEQDRSLSILKAVYESLAQ
jgi:CubicO group peptidase (beta-lactamase class C family)